MENQNENSKDLTLDLNQLAILLTVLDKEAYITKYFKRMIPPGEETDDFYLESLYEIQKVMVKNLSPETVPVFVQKNPHLQTLFLAELTDFSEFIEEWENKNASTSLEE